MNEDINPELLKESGRASAIQDLASKAKEAADRGAAVEKAVVSAVTEENKKFRRQSRRQNLLLIVMAVLLAFTAFNSKSNSDVLKNLDKNQKGIDSLVQFVDSVKTSQSQGQQANAAVIAQIAQIAQDSSTVLKVICTVTDPARKAACDAAGVATAP